LAETVAGVDDPGHRDFTDDAELFTASDDYELLEEIGRGGQGVVYRARQKSLNLRCIKGHRTRHGTQSAPETVPSRRSCRKWSHPFVVPIHEIGQRNGRCYFSMGLVEGGRLDQVAKREPLSSRQAAEVIAKLARTVHHAHEHGIVHRDVKPGNILLDTKGEPHLTDFGVARLLETEKDATRTIEVLGTPSYMAPEQAQGNQGQLSRATDVYGLGAVLYQLLTGQPPFAGETPYDGAIYCWRPNASTPSVECKVDRDLSICLKCLEKIQSAATLPCLLAEDEHWLKHEPIRARHTGLSLAEENGANQVSLLWWRCRSSRGRLGAMVWESQFILHPRTTGSPCCHLRTSATIEKRFLCRWRQDDLLTKLGTLPLSGHQPLV
jgi:serine/threonine-protein kinase